MVTMGVAPGFRLVIANAFPIAGRPAEFNAIGQGLAFTFIPMPVLAHLRRTRGFGRDRLDPRRRTRAENRLSEPASARHTPCGSFPLGRRAGRHGQRA